MKVRRTHQLRFTNLAPVLCKCYGLNFYFMRISVSVLPEEFILLSDRIFPPALNLSLCEDERGNRRLRSCSNTTGEADG